MPKDGFEPSTSSFSGKRSRPTELFRLLQHWYILIYFPDLLGWGLIFNTVLSGLSRERLELSRQLRHTILSRTWLPISTPRESSPYIDIDTGTLIVLFFDKWDTKNLLSETRHTEPFISWIGYTNDPLWITFLTYLNLPLEPAHLFFRLKYDNNSINFTPPLELQSNLSKLTSDNRFKR